MGNKSNDGSKEEDKSNYVIIKNGEIIQGKVDKSIYQSRTNGIIHSVVNENGNNEARHVFDNTQKIICNWLVYATVGSGTSNVTAAKNSGTFQKTVKFSTKYKIL